MICSIIKQLQFEVLQNAIREKSAKLEELKLLKVRLWLVLEYCRNGNFRDFWYWAGGIFQFPNGNSRWPCSRPIFQNTDK